MPKITIKAIIKRVTRPETVGKNNTLMQRVIFLEPGYTDTFGEKKGTDNLWEGKLFNDRINKFNLSGAHHEKKAEVTLYLQSRLLLTNGGVENYIVDATIGDIKIL